MTPDLPTVFRTTVVRTERLTPHMVRVVVTGPGLDAFPDAGFSDRYVKLIFPRPGVTHPADMAYAEIRSTLPPGATSSASWCRCRATGARARTRTASRPRSTSWPPWTRPPPRSGPPPDPYWRSDPAASRRIRSPAR